MPRKLSFKGEDLKEANLVIGNHEDVHVDVSGSYILEGLVYCPRYSLQLTIRGNSTVALHGVCKRLIIKSASGNCLLDFGDMHINEFSCRELRGSAVLKIRRPKFIIERNIYDSAKLLVEEHRSTTQAVVVANDHKNKMYFQ